MKHLKLKTILSIALLGSIPLARFVMSNDAIITDLSTSNVQAYSEGDDYRKFYILYEVRVKISAELFASGNLSGWSFSDGFNNIIERITEANSNFDLTAYTVAFNLQCEQCKKRKANCVPQLMGRYVVNDDGTISYAG